MVINYVYYFVVFYSIFKKDYFLTYYPYYNGKHNEIGFLNLIKTILNYFFVVQYLVYFPAFVKSYELNIRNYFALLDFGLPDFILLILKCFLPLSILWLISQCRCYKLIDLRIYIPHDIPYIKNIIVINGQKIAKENGIIIVDDFHDELLMETTYISSTSEDD